MTYLMDYHHGGWCFHGNVSVGCQHQGSGSNVSFLSLVCIISYSYLCNGYDEFLMVTDNQLVRLQYPPVVPFMWHILHAAYLTFKLQ